LHYLFFHFPWALKIYRFLADDIARKRFIIVIFIKKCYDKREFTDPI
jgi:hypothetical protein